MGGLSVLGGLMKGAAGVVSQSKGPKNSDKLEKSRKEYNAMIKTGAGTAGGIDLDVEFRKLDKRPVGRPEARTVYDETKVKRGGRIQKTGSYQLDKGEIVVPGRIAKQIRNGKRRSTRRTARR